jgi:hypothetical protein
MAQIFGKIHRILETQKISDNFMKREFVVKSDEQFPQLILLELQHDNVFQLDNFAVGNNVIVSINIRGRMWTSPLGEDKFFNTLVAWKIERSAADIASPTPAPAPQPSYSPSSNINEEEEDDLPF